MFKVWVCLGFLVVGGGGAVVGSPGGWTADLNCCALGFEVEELVAISDVRGAVTEDVEGITGVVDAILVESKIADTAPVLELLMACIGLHDTAVDVWMVGTERDIAVLGPVVDGRGSKLHLCVL